MSKNLTRKGLATGAFIALASTLIAGAPAHAAPAISFETYAGTSYKTVLGSEFHLKSALSDWSGTGAEIKVSVTGADAADIEVAGGTGTTAALAETDLDDNGAFAAIDSTDLTGTVTTGGASVGKYTGVGIKLGAGVTATTTVTAYLFADGYAGNPADGIWSAGEPKSASQTITFVKASEVTAATTLDAPLIGVASLTAHVTLGDINLQQIFPASLVTVNFKENGTAADERDTAWVKADAALTATTTAYIAGENKVYTAKAEVKLVASGNTASTTPVNGTETITSAGAPATDVSANVIDGAGDTYTVRAGTTSVKATSAAEYTNADGVVAQAAPAGIKARVTVAKGNTFATTSVVRAGGKEFTGASTSTGTLTYDAVTNADGKVVVDVSATGKAADVITISVSYLSDGAYVDSAATTYTWAAATTPTVKVLNHVNHSGSRYIGVKKGESFSISYKAVDEFGAPISTGNTKNELNLKIKVKGDDLPAAGKVLSFVNGVATVTVKDDSLAVGGYDLEAEVADYDGTDHTFAGSFTPVSALLVAVKVQDSVTPAFLTADASSTAVALEYDAFIATFDEALDNNTSAVIADLARAHTITGQVLSADGNPSAGVAVTISGAGLQFISGSSPDRFAATDKLVVYTNATGNYSVDVDSHKAGTQSITVSAGSMTKVVTRKWDAAGDDKATAIAITAPAYAAAGQSVNVIVALTDKFGNPVKFATEDVTRFSIAASGAGISGTITNKTDADGVSKFYQLLSSNDTGSFKVTVKYDADGASTAKAEISKVATVTIGTAPVAAGSTTAAIAGSTKRMFVSVTGNSTAKNVVVKVAGRTVATLKGSAAKKTYTIRATKGSKKVTVFVGGKLIATKTVSVK